MGSTLASILQGLQRSLISAVMRLPRDRGEDDLSFWRRRGREAARHAVRVGLWDKRAAVRILSWAGHMQRGHAPSWAVQILPVQCSRWLQVKRAAAKSLSVFAGILGSRESPGRPPIRFEEGVEYCSSLVKSSEAAVSPP